jgi:hypothetical protein
MRFRLFLFAVKHNELTPIDPWAENVNLGLIQKVLRGAQLYLAGGGGVEEVQVGADLGAEEELTAAAELFGEPAGDEDEIVPTDPRHLAAVGELKVGRVVAFVVGDQFARRLHLRRKVALQKLQHPGSVVLA